MFSWPHAQEPPHSEALPKMPCVYVDGSPKYVNKASETPLFLPPFSIGLKILHWAYTRTPFSTGTSNLKSSYALN